MRGKLYIVYKREYAARYATLFVVFWDLISDFKILLS